MTLLSLKIAQLLHRVSEKEVPTYLLL